MIKATRRAVEMKNNSNNNRRQRSKVYIKKNRLHSGLRNPFRDGKNFDQKGAKP